MCNVECVSHILDHKKHSVELKRQFALNCYLSVFCVTGLGETGLFASGIRLIISISFRGLESEALFQLDDVPCALRSAHTLIFQGYWHPTLITDTCLF